MSQVKLKKGDKVERETSQGTTSGKVEKKLTSPMEIKAIKWSLRRTTLNIL